jgi:hypothetical protein
VSPWLQELLFSGTGMNIEELSFPVNPLQQRKFIEFKNKKDQPRTVSLSLLAHVR